MFRDVQDQFIKKADCIISSINHHGSSIVCEVDQQRMVFDMLVYSRYQVVYCLQSSEVQCDYFMFQSDGILCYHILAILLHFCCPHNTFYPDGVRMLVRDTHTSGVS
ncbi:hypothetical protein Ahy_B10g100749 [Arachis hypogaea]|uniref:SWIM-type domain-containing protein n=1 Tax=Arachis hypogaea TaxID=3818 RepID=A0A444WXH4_ARAHY|nr:hypothetical protein Ahy_B10g100749 [Arachis hypogaea]